MEVIEFDRPKYNRLQISYKQAVVDGKDVFLFEGHELVTSYAKYLLEYLKLKFNESTDKN